MASFSLHNRTTDDFDTDKTTCWLLIAVLFISDCAAAAASAPTSGPTASRPRPLSEAHRTEEPSHWRDADHGGMNALYVLLRVYGYTGKYADLLSAAPELRPPSSVVDMRQLSQELGYPLAARRLSPGTLREIELPIIVYLDGDGAKSGAYLLLMGCLENEVVYMNGPSATIDYMDYESFYRRWNGVAILPAFATRGHVAEMAAGVGGGFAVCLFYRRSSARRPRANSR